MSTTLAPALERPRVGVARGSRARSAPGVHSQFPRGQRLFRAAPLVFAAAAFAGGIGVARGVWFAPAWVGLASVALLFLAGVAAFACPTRAAYVPLAALWLLLGVLAAETQPQPTPQKQMALLADGDPHRVTGEVVKMGPVRRVVSYAPFSEEPRTELTQSIDLRTFAITGETGVALPVDGGIRLSLYGRTDRPFPSLACGDVLTGEITLRTPERYRDPGVWNSGAWLLDQGIGALGSAKVETLSRAARAGRPGVSCRVHAWQQAWSGRLLAYAERSSAAPRWFSLAPEDAAMLSSMVTGDRTWLGRTLRSEFERTGSFHLLVVSGLHLGLFASLVFQAGRLLRLPRGLTALLTLALSFGYALLTGFGEPVRRALAMVALYLLGRLLFRERSGMNALGFAALALLLLSPRALFDTGLQMTLLSVAAVVGIAQPLAETTFAPYLRATRQISLAPLDSGLPPRVAQFRVHLRLIGGHVQPLVSRRVGARRGQALCALAARLCLSALEVVCVSAVIELAMALPMAAYFHRITVFGLFVNVLVAPALGLLLPCAFLTLLTLLAAPKLAGIPAAGAAAVLHAVTGVIHAFSHINFGELRVPGPAAAGATASAALFAAAMWLIRRPRFGVPLGLCALAASTAAALLPRSVARQPHALEVTAVDVGQGDAVLVVSPSGKTLLVDAGGRAGGFGANHGNFETGEDVVSPYLWRRGVRRLDAVALTHAHSDHMGGMPAVLRNFRPRELWVGKNPEIPEYTALLAEARELGVRVRPLAAGDEIAFGEATVRVLAPAADYHPGLKAVNNDSLVLHIDYGKTSALLEGDAEAPSEERMLAEGGLRADLLKVGHHGSKTSSIPPFLDAVAPRYAVISVGLHNSYHHPRWDTLEHLQQRHALTWRTDLLGISTFYLDGARVTTPQ